MATINPIDSQMPVEVAKGGTGDSTQTAYGVICANTTSTGALVNVGAGTSGQLLQATGASAPNWVTATDPGSVFVVTTATYGPSTPTQLASSAQVTYVGAYLGTSNNANNVGWYATLNCIIDQLYVNVVTNTASTNVTVTLYQNGNATSLTTTITASTAGTFSDTNTAHAVYVKTGDIISWIMSQPSTGFTYGSISARGTSA